MALYVKSELSLKVRDDLAHPDIETIWVEIQPSKQPPILICFLYRLPSARQEYFNNLIDRLENAVHEEHHLIILGDFNVNYSLYDSNDTHPIRLLETFFGLQLIAKPTRVTL